MNGGRGRPRGCTSILSSLTEKTSKAQRKEIKKERGDSMSSPKGSSKSIEAAVKLGRGIQRGGPSIDCEQSDQVDK